jgi:hypothetical protein
MENASSLERKEELEICAMCSLNEVALSSCISINQVAHKFTRRKAQAISYLSKK